MAEYIKIKVCDHQAQNTELEAASCIGKVFFIGKARMREGLNVMDEVKLNFKVI